MWKIENKLIKRALTLFYLKDCCLSPNFGLNLIIVICEKL